MKDKEEVKTFNVSNLADVPKIELVTSGVAEIDEVTMLPRGRITEIYGNGGVGKTTLMMKCIAAMSQDGKVLYIDAENALNPDRMRQYPIKPENITISTEFIMEDVTDLVMDGITKYDVIIVDSIAGLSARTEYTGEAGQANIGIKAKLMHQWMRRMVGDLAKTRCALVFVNQLREGLDVYTPKYTTGGKALTFATTLRIELSSNKADRIIKEGETIGHWVKFEVTKSKIGKPFQKGRFKLIY